MRPGLCFALAGKIPGNKSSGGILDTVLGGEKRGEQTAESTHNHVDRILGTECSALISIPSLRWIMGFLLAQSDAVSPRPSR